MSFLELMLSLSGRFLSLSGRKCGETCSLSTLMCMNVFASAPGPYVLIILLDSLFSWDLKGDDVSFKSFADFLT